MLLVVFSLCATILSFHMARLLIALIKYFYDMK